MKFYGFFHIIFVLFCFVVYMVVCIVCFYLILYNLLCILFVMFMCSHCYICSGLGIVFHYVVQCMVYVFKYTVLLPPIINPIAVNRYIISFIHRRLFPASVNNSTCTCKWSSSCFQLVTYFSR